MLNGSRDWKLAGTYNQVNTKVFALVMPSMSKGHYDIATVISDSFKNVNNSNDYNADNHEYICCSGSTLYIRIFNSKLSSQDTQGFKQCLQANNVTVVYLLAEEKVYECTNLDLITYSDETNYIVNSGAIIPKTTLKVHNNISNVVSLLQKKVSLLESNITNYMITQNRLILSSRYNTDSVSFKVDIANTYTTEQGYDEDLYRLISDNITAGKDNYNKNYIEEIIWFYYMDFKLSDEMLYNLLLTIELQHNQIIEEETLA